MIHRPRVRWLLVSLLVILWVLAIYPAYYVVHHPLTATALRALASAGGDLLAATALFAVAVALGSRLTRRIEYNSLLERIVFSAALGLVLFSLLTFALGLLGLLYRWLFWPLLLAIGILLWHEWRALGRALAGVSWSLPHKAWPRFLSFFIAGTLLAALLLALTPPVEWDTLIYHVVAPDEYLRAHRITHRFDNYALFTPLFTQMLFTIGTALKGDVVPGLIHYGFMLLTLGAVSSFATRYWERDLGLVAAAFFVTIPTAVLIATWAYVDLAVTFYSFVAVYALFVYLRATGADSERRPTGSMGWLLLAGVFAGASISIKYMGASIVLVLGAILVWWLIRRKLTPRHFLVTSLVLAGLTLAVGGGWYLKNAIVAGNPIYPLVWGGRGWNEISTRWLLTLGEELSLVDLLTVPWTVTVLGTQGTVAYDATFSPLFLLLVPLLLFVPRRAVGLAELGLAAGVGYLGWLASGAVSYGQFVLQGRFLLPIFAPLSLLSAYALDGMRAWDRPGFSLHRVLKMLAALTMVVTLLSQVLFVARFNPVPFLTGYESRQAFQDRMITQQWNQAISYINENLGADDRVMFVWEPRIYGLRVAYQADVVFDNVSQLVYRYGSPERVLLGLCEEGFTHMLVNRYTYQWIVTDYPLTAGERSVWEAFEADYLTDDSAVYTDGTYLTLYALPCNGTTR